MKIFGKNINRSPAAWNLPTLIINAAQIITNSLSAITANIGNLVMGKNGSIAIGETAYAVGAGIWLGIDSSGNPQFSIQDKNGNYINIAMTSGGVLGISSSGLVGALTSKQVDDQGWRNTGVWNQVSGTPTTRAGYGITDAQGTLPNASATGQVLQRDTGGSPYFSAKYGKEMAYGSTALANTNLTAASFVQIGATLGIGNPGTTNFFCIFTGFAGTNLGTETLKISLQYSINGGSSWTDLQGVVTLAIGTNSTPIALSGGITLVTPSGDVDFRVVGENASATNTISVSGNLSAFIMPNANFYTTAGALTASIPTTGSGNCTANYPSTTCTASETVTVSPAGGTPPYTYAWSVVSGTGTITAGSTSQTCTVSDTETATTGGATFNTVVKCTVTDSVPNNVATGNDTITNTFTLVYPAIVATVSTTNGNCSNGTCGVNCTGSGTATANPSGGNGSYTYSWSVVSGTGTIVSGSTSQTCTVHDTESTATWPGVTYTTTVQCSVNDTRGTGAVTPQNSLNLKFTCPAH